MESWRKLLFVLLYSQCREKNRGLGFAPFCFSETVNLRDMKRYYNRFGCVSVCVYVCVRTCVRAYVCVLIEMRLRRLENAKPSQRVFLLLAWFPHSDVQVRGTAGGQADAMIHIPFSPSFSRSLPHLSCFSSSFASSLWLGNGYLVLTTLFKLAHSAITLSMKPMHNNTSWTYL